MKFCKERDPELIRAAQTAYAEAPPAVPGRWLTLLRNRGTAYAAPADQPRRLPVDRRI